MKRFLVPCFVLSAIALAGGGAYRTTKHGDPLNGVQRLASEPRGECAQCHDQHASHGDTPTGGPYPYLLFAPDDNLLCLSCHATSGALSIWQGDASWNTSSHATSGGAVWPGPVPPSRPNADAGKCVNCHDAHGQSDASGLIPAQTFQREENLCYPCHDGSPAADIRRQFQKISKHPIAITGKHDETEGNDPARFGASPTNNRHAECADCHNPHLAGPTAAFSNPAPAARPPLAGTSRIRVSNGPAGTRPFYTFAGPADPTPALEYEICFKCHSSWTVLPAGKPDLGVLLNSTNASFHPVEGTGKNINVNASSFVNGWTWDRLTYCSDCHTSDNPTIRGPHGSANPGLLPGPYPASPALRTMTSDEACFSCHRFDTYANGSAPTAVPQAASRFNPPAYASGHTLHAARSVPCYACHETHGSASQPALIVLGRNPGLLSYSQTSSGGTCTPSGCHSTRSYTALNYPR